MAVGDGSVRSLEYTPTWALAAVCFVFIASSIFIEHAIHLLASWLKRNKKTSMHGAVEKFKSELMLVGFISLLLAVTQDYIVKICIPGSMADTMLPCRKETAPETATAEHIVEKFLRRLAEEEDSSSTQIVDSCSAKGKVALVTKEGIHQLHIFIFVLAAVQVVYSTGTMALGKAKMRRWRAWENETQTIEYLAANDPNRFRYTRQTTFGRRHMNDCTESTTLLWIKCFFRQFFNSVAKVDYFTLRHGFISAHFSARHNNFNFQQYIKRSLEEDFNIVVGISPLMWFGVIILLLVDVHGWHVYTWLSYVPILIVLVLGTKLEMIVARMALQIKKHNSVIVGMPLVKPNDNHFWFGNPRFVLTLIHYSLFVSAFELSFFIWVTVQFGMNSCYHAHTAIVITRVVFAVIVQVLCTYITLPLYALVTQMGSEFKRKPLEEQTGNIVRRWLHDVREKRRNNACAPLSPEWSPRLSGAAAEDLPSITNKPYKGEIVEVDEDEDEEQERRSQPLSVASLRDLVPDTMRG